MKHAKTKSASKKSKSSPPVTKLVSSKPDPSQKRTPVPKAIYTKDGTIEEQVEEAAP